jgi:hypothetical protein
MHLRRTHFERVDDLRMQRGDVFQQKSVWQAAHAAVDLHHVDVAATDLFAQELEEGRVEQ